MNETQTQNNPRADEPMQKVGGEIPASTWARAKAHAALRRDRSVWVLVNRAILATIAAETSADQRAA